MCRSASWIGSARRGLGENPGGVSELDRGTNGPSGNYVPVVNGIPWEVKRTRQGTLNLVPQQTRRAHFTAAVGTGSAPQAMSPCQLGELHLNQVLARRPTL